jgi:predicted acyltransferase (DUF342 family)
MLALLLGLPAPACANDDISKVNGAVRTEASHVYGDLTTVNGSIELATRVRAAEVSTVNGGIRSEASASAREMTTVNGSIRLGQGNLVTGDLTTVNGGIRVGEAGRVDGDVTTVNGAITLVHAQVGGQLTTVNGDITVGANSLVRGGLRVEKAPSHWWWPIRLEVARPAPKIVIGPNAVVEGTLEFRRAVVLYVHDTARVGPISGAVPVHFSGQEPPASP